MRNFLLPSSLFASVLFLGALGACGDDNGGTPTDAGSNPDVVRPEGGKDTGGGGDGGDSGMVACVDISGTDEFDVKIVSGPFSSPTSTTDHGTPVPMAAVRIETMDGTGCLDVTADSNGQAKLMVNKAKGPFNITGALAMMGAGSLMNVAAPADIGGKNIWIPTALTETDYAISGAIANATAATDSFQLDCADFFTLWHTGSSVAFNNYSTKQAYVAQDSSTVNIAGIEIDTTTNCFGHGCFVKGVWTPDQARVKGPMTQDVDFNATGTGSYTSSTPILGTATINLASTGQFTGAMVKKVGDLTLGTATPGAWTNSTVEKLVGESAAYVGAGLLLLPVSNVALFHMQTFGGTLKPDVATAFFYDGAGNSLTSYVTTFTDSTVTVPALTKLMMTSNGTGAPSALDDLQFDFDATGADFVTASMYEPNSTKGPSWLIYMPKVTGAAFHVPHLPAAVQLSDFSTAAQFIVNLDAVKGVVPADWADGAGSGAANISTWAYGYQVQAAATGR